MNNKSEDVRVERVICAFFGFVLGGVCGVLIETLRILTGSSLAFEGGVILASSLVGAAIGAVAREGVFKILVALGSLFAGAAQGLAPEFLLYDDVRSKIYGAWRKHWPVWAIPIFAIGAVIGFWILYG